MVVRKWCDEEVRKRKIVHQKKADLGGKLNLQWGTVPRHGMAPGELLKASGGFGRLGQSGKRVENGWKKECGGTTRSSLLVQFRNWGHDRADGSCRMDKEGSTLFQHWK